MFLMTFRLVETIKLQTVKSKHCPEWPTLLGLYFLHNHLLCYLLQFVYDFSYLSLIEIFEICL